jgi:hypothetical protein
MKDCTWFPWCADPARHEVERRTSGGSTLREVVCERHLSNACDHGFGRTPLPDHSTAASPDEPA